MKIAVYVLTLLVTLLLASLLKEANVDPLFLYIVSVPAILFNIILSIREAYRKRKYR